MLISHNKINEIIDDAQPYAKIVCDKLSSKVTDDIGRNDYFMNILDKSFDIICESEIEHLKDIFDVYLLTHKSI